MSQQTPTLAAAPSLAQQASKAVAVSLDATVTVILAALASFAGAAATLSQNVALACFPFYATTAYTKKAHKALKGRVAKDGNLSGLTGATFDKIMSQVAGVASSKVPAVVKVREAYMAGQYPMPLQAAYDLHRAAAKQAAEEAEEEGGKDSKDSERTKLLRAIGEITGKLPVSGLKAVLKAAQTAKAKADKAKEAAEAKKAEKAVKANAAK